jgi:KAP family P-loop domain
MVKGAPRPGPPIFSDAPVSSRAYDSLGRLPVAERLIALVTRQPELPLVIALEGAAGSGKTSVLYMTGELCAARTDLRAFSIDAWVAGDAAHVNEDFLREVSRIFEEERVVGQAEKVRDRLFALGDYVSAVARFAGVKVDVKGALEKTPDALRDEVMKLTEAIGKRIVVIVDHLDRLPPTETIAVLKQIQRWGTFPYFAFVLGLDRGQMVHTLRRIDGDDDDLDRIVSIELPLPAVDRAELAAWVRGGLAELARALGVDPGPALGVFDVEGGVGLGLVRNLRHAKRLLNALGAALPLAGPGADLRRALLIELVREFLPAAYPAVEGGQLDALPPDADELRAFAAHHPRPAAARRLIEALLASATPS